MSQQVCFKSRVTAPKLAAPHENRGRCGRFGAVISAGGV